MCSPKPLIRPPAVHMLTQAIVACLLLLSPLKAFRGNSVQKTAALTNADQLLVISPGDATSTKTLTDSCAELAKSGVKRLLLREPRLSKRQIEKLCSTLSELYPRDGLILHETCAGARSIAAARGLGLHLESTSDWKEERKQFRGKLGVSARSESDAQRAAQCGFNWAFLPQWSVGEAAVLRAQRALPEIDVIALGGVTPASAARLAAGGGRGVAVLGGIFGEGSSPADVRDAASEYIEALKQVFQHSSFHNRAGYLA